MKTDNVLLLIMSIWELEDKYNDSSLLDKAVYNSIIEKRKKILEKEGLYYNSLERNIYGRKSRH